MPVGRFWGSTIGKKVVMAVTGIVLTVYVIGHMTGNLLVFRGPEAINAYVFSSTLAAQDITGLSTSGVSAAHVAKRLEGSAESLSYLFALTTREAPRPLGELGYPALSPDDLLDVEASAAETGSAGFVAGSAGAAGARIALALATAAAAFFFPSASSLGTAASSSFAFFSA